jgi:dihydrolipoamide dehydrogenase
MTEQQKYDVIVVGAGPGGYVCAIRAAQLGLRTAIVDKHWLGGVCLNVGCVPSKSLLWNAEIAHILRDRAKDFGIGYENLQLDYAAAVQRSRKASDRLTKGVALLMRRNNIDVFMGSAYLSARDTVQITAEDGQQQEITAENIVIATGAHTALIPGWEVDGEYIVTYLEAILQERLPKSVVIIGAGAIGMEFATIWSSYGSEVTIVEMLPQVLPLADSEISAELEKAFKRRKIRILTNHRVQSVKKTEDGVTVQVSQADKELTLEAEQALVAIGFRPNTADLGLEDIGVALDKRGFIQIDERMATTVPGIWSIGDVTGKLLLAHVASTQGIVCAENIAGVETVKLDYQMMPSAVFSNPQVAYFGFTEEQAKQAGHEIKVGRFPFLANGKSLGMGETTGFIKIIEDANNQKLLGAHMIGPEVSELLPELTLAWQHGLNAADIGRNVHTHPTLSEVIMEAAHDVEGHAIHK